MEANVFYSFAPMRVLLIDNYDSFTFNLVHALEPMVNELIVWRNDEFELSDVASFDKIIFSPGPSLPNEAGLMMQVIEKYHRKIPMFGVCLGFQAIVEFFNGELINIEPVRHGIQREIHVKSESLFRGLKPIQKVGLYHSWAVKTDQLPKVLSLLSWDSNNVVMAFEHEMLNMVGVQFHPESIMTPNGKEMLAKWISQ